MKDSYKAVVIGGGIVGASVLYHLTKLGWADVALIERAELTAGSTWHAAAGFHALNGDPNIAALQEYSINLYREIEKESGQSCGLHLTGGVNFARTPDTWEQIKSGFATFQAIGIDTARLVTPGEIRELTHGLIRTDDILGGMFDSNEGHLDPNGATHAFAIAARKRGADIVLRNRVLSLTPRPDGAWDVVTEQGTIRAENVVNAAGLWARQVGRMAGVELPMTPMEHHYLVTDDIDAIAALPGELPTIADLDAVTYARQERNGLLLGVYERNPKHWMMDGAPWDYGMELIPEDIERIGEELETGIARYPMLADAGIRRWVNGAFTFAPDGNPLVGPVGPRGYWVACGVMAGFSQGGGVGKSLAEWMVRGAPEADIFGMDVARFGPHHANRAYIRQTTAQFYARRMAVAFPNERLPAGRPLRQCGAYHEMTEAGARWDGLWGLEVPLYFAPKGFVEPPTLRRSAAFPIVAGECAAVRDAVGLLDISSFARYRVTGPRAREWLDHMLACRLPGPGRLKLAPMLDARGRLKGDMTCFNWGEVAGDGTAQSIPEFWLTSSYSLRAFHMRWFRDHLVDGVTIEDVSDQYAGFAITGPRARAVLDAASETRIEAFGMMRCQQMDLGLHRVRLARLSLSGEASFEIHCHPAEHAALQRLLLNAGQSQGIREVGWLAMMSMRLEKGVGIWNAEYRLSHTPAMTGLDRWCAFDKGDFVGRQACLASAPPARVLVMLAVDARDADAAGFEPVWKDGHRIGITTSGGYGHRTGLSLALAMVDRSEAVEGNSVRIHVAGEERTARIVPRSPYDPAGHRMRLD